MPAAVGLVAGLADVPVDLAPGVEALLLVRRQRRDRRRGARLSRPARCERATSRPAPPSSPPRGRERRERRRLGRQLQRPAGRPAGAAVGCLRERVRAAGPARPPDRSGTARPAPPPGRHRGGQASRAWARPAARLPRRAAARRAARPDGCSSRDRPEQLLHRAVLRRCGTIVAANIVTAASRCGVAPASAAAAARARPARCRGDRSARRRATIGSSPRAVEQRHDGALARPAGSAPSEAASCCRTGPVAIVQPLQHRGGTGMFGFASQRSAMRIAAARTSRA